MTDETMTNEPVHVMLDLETLGTRPGSVILSIGAVAFGPKGADPGGLILPVNRRSCFNAGLTEDVETVKWWNEQSGMARQVLKDSLHPEALYISEALEALSTWVEARRLEGTNGGLRPLRVWGNGAAFDNALIAEAAVRCGKRPLWSHRDDRCFRTLKAMRPDVRALPFEGTPHNAADDARNQAVHAVRILDAHGGWE